MVMIIFQSSAGSACTKSRNMKFGTHQNTSDIIPYHQVHGLAECAFLQSVLIQGRKTVFVSCRAVKRMFRCLFLMTWPWHGVCEDSSCLLSFQRSKPVTGGGVLDKMSRNVMRFLSSMTQGTPFYQPTITE